MITKRIYSIAFTGAMFALAGCTLGRGGPPTPVSGEYDLPATQEILILSPEELERQLAGTAVPGRLPIRFSLYSEKPVLQHGKSNTWDGSFISPGAIVYHEGLFHMFYNGSRFIDWGEISARQIGLAISLDGYEWHRVQDEAVFTPDEVEYADNISSFSVLVEDDNTWVMYFSGWSRVSASRATNFMIGRATAEAPGGPWIADDAAALSLGAPGAWDSDYIYGSIVVKTVAGYRMYYTGQQETNSAIPWIAQIGMAESPDGITWTKFDDPATTSGKYAESDPVLSFEESSVWDSDGISAPQIWKTPDHWVMAYQGIRQGMNYPQIGYATSPDGIVWTRYKGNPVVSLGSLLPGYYSGGLLFFPHEGVMNLYFSTSKNIRDEYSTFDIYLVTAN